LNYFLVDHLITSNQTRTAGTPLHTRDFTSMRYAFAQIPL
jgi:hypothetical protein